MELTSFSDLSSRIDDNSDLTNLTGTLAVDHGGTGQTTFTANKILIGDGTNAIKTHTSLHWDSVNGRLGIGTVTPSQILDVSGNIKASGNFYGNGSQLTSLNAGNIASGTLPVNRGGTGQTTFAENKILIGDGTNGIKTYTSLHWNNTNNRLGIGTATPSEALDVIGNIKTSGNFYGNGSQLTSLNAGNIASGTLPVNRGGTGQTTFASNKILIGDGTNGIKTYTSLHWNNTNNRLGIGTATPISILNLYESTGTVHGSNKGTLVLDHGNSGGASSIVFRSRQNIGSDYGYIQYQDRTTTTTTSGESARLILGTSNDADDHLILQPSGNVGIGTNNPGQKLDVSGNIKASGNFYGNGSQLTSLNANNITTGTVHINRIPNMDAGKITSGNFDYTRINNFPHYLSFKRIRFINDWAINPYYSVSENAMRGGFHIDNIGLTEVGSSDRFFYFKLIISPSLLGTGGGWGGEWWFNMNPVESSDIVVKKSGSATTCMVRSSSNPLFSAAYAWDGSKYNLYINTSPANLNQYEYIFSEVYRYIHIIDYLS
jgi:hypothetical protein